MSVEVTDNGGVRRITLNRPESFNSFDDEMGMGFAEAVQDCRTDSVRCVVISGAGKAFSAGEDLRALQSGYESGTPPDLGEILRRRYNPAISTIVELEKPVVAEINGVAAGAGVSVALACDFRLMAEGASLVLAFAKAGLVPDSGATWLLPRYVGLGRALELSILGDPIKASDALNLGLVNKVVPPEQLRSETDDLAGRLAVGPTLAYGLIKRLIWTTAPGFDAHLESEADAQTQAGKSGDHMEGVKAFLEKRAPQFKGA